MIDYESSLVNTDHVAFPDTQAVNISAPGSGDGTEFVALLVNDIWGRAQALMAHAGLTPDGVSEAAGTAQFLEALFKGLNVGPGFGVIYWKNDTPAALGDRVLLLQGQVIAIASYPLLAAAVYCGDGLNATAPAFYKTSDAGGTTRSTAGTYLVLPDTRGLSLKGVGDATVNTRVKTGPAVLAEVQEDQGQGHRHEYKTKNYNTPDASPYWARGASADAGSEHNTVGGVTDPITDGTNGTPRTGTYTRDNSMGVNYGIGY
jgi:hypothetical protein